MQSETTFPTPATTPPEDDYDICYWLDVGDTIVDIAPGWEHFANANDAPDLDVRRVIGRNLMNYVHGDVTRMFVRTLIQSARLLRRPLVRPYRCDSPEVRRDMEMRLCVEDSGLLRWEHRLVSATPFERRIAFAPAEPTEARRCTVRCSMCNRLKSPRGWHEPVDQPPPAETCSPLPVIYGVCPECLNYPERAKLHAR